MVDLEEIKNSSLKEVATANSSDELEKLRVVLFGKKGRITSLFQELGKAAPEEKKQLGQQINILKNEIQEALDSKRVAAEKAELDSKLQTEWVDVTIPPREVKTGTLHPITKAIAEISDYFTALGFEVKEGPEIEDEEHNFDMLNFRPDHPAKEMHDTFYLNNNKVLRTHTSPVQVRTMKAGEPPFYIIAPGATFRCDSDQTHTPMFHQIEGLVIDKNIDMGHLKGCVDGFLKDFFNIKDLKTRFRPSYFPFTEPSAEVDIGCDKSGTQLKIGQGNDWMEIMGCGMVHPNVLKNCGINPDEWQGFAFGLGVERMAMLKYGISDLRQFFANDIRWLKHYGFSAFEV